MPPRAAPADARARAALRGSLRSRGRGRRGGAVPQLLLPPALSLGLQPGDLARRGAAPGPQLRLQPQRLRCDRDAIRLARPRGDGGQRRALGSRRRRERRRPCGLAHLRRAARGGRRLRRAADPALRAADLLDHGGGGARAGAHPLPHELQRHRARCRARLSHRLSRARPRRRHQPCRGRDQPSGAGGMVEPCPLHRHCGAGALPAAAPDPACGAPGALHRRLPAPAALFDRLRGGFRHALHRRLSPGLGRDGPALARRGLARATSVAPASASADVPSSVRTASSSTDRGTAGFTPAKLRRRNRVASPTASAARVAGWASPSTSSPP